MTPEQRERLEDLSKIQPTHYIGELDRAAIRAALTVLTTAERELDEARALLREIEEGLGAMRPLDTKLLDMAVRIREHLNG